MQPMLSLLTRLRRAASHRSFWILSGAFVAITALHYLSPQVQLLPLTPYLLEHHAVERIVFLLPVIGAACAFGQRGGLVTLALAIIIMLPRASLMTPHPAEALLEIVAVAVAGYFAIWAIETQACEKRLRQELSERLQRAYNRLQTLYESAETVSSTLELQQVLDRLVQATAEAMGVQGCSIRLLDESKTWMYVAATYGLSQAYVKKGDLILERNPLAREVLSGKVIAIDDVTKDGRLQYPAQAIAEGIRSMLSAPLLGKRGPLGLIRVYSTELNHFKDDDAAFLTAIASQGSIAIENAMAYAALSELDEAKYKFILTVTHELRSPVSVVRSLLRTLGEGYAGTATDQQRDLVARALYRADFLQELIDDLLDLAAGKSKLDTGEQVPVDLVAAVEDVAKRFKVPAEEKKLKLEWHCPSAEYPLRVLATQEGVDRILNNLVSNAIKYTPTGGHVSVVLHRAGKEARLEIADSGIGIPADSLPHLFTEFYRAPNAKALQKEGTGLGLAITKDLVTRFGGQITVQSKLGQGTTFTVSFPLQSEDSQC